MRPYAFDSYDEFFRHMEEVEKEQRSILWDTLQNPWKVKFHGGESSEYPYISNEVI